MSPDDPRGRRDAALGDLLRTSVVVPPLPHGFSDEVRSQLAGIDEQDSRPEHPSRRHARRRVLLAVAALVAQGESIIHGAESVSKSFPAFVETLQALGAEVA